MKPSNKFFIKFYFFYCCSSLYRIHGFLVEQTRHIPELELTAIQLRHEATGAEHLHIARDDDNNVFGVGFSTPPMSSSGTPHILEHTTLCGSKKFPVRDPFFKMLNRSLANFMNAFTANDYTIYPFSTTHLLDYENLRDVYMDATFHPYLRELDFKQEGWRLEHQIPHDRATPLQFKGVVYNEMKGQMSDAGYLYYSRVQQYMYPGTAYGYNSGGEPRNITDLTHQELLDFHKSHYHPSNAKFYTYGNFPLENHLMTINNKIKDFTKLIPDQGIKIIKPFDKPQRIVFQGPIDPMNNSEKQTKMSISFLTNDITDVVETFALRLFAYLLLDGHASPMYKALIDTNIGSDFSENTGYDSSTRISSLSIGLQGMKSQDIPLAEQTIRKVLEDIHRNGFDSKRIEAALHQTELGKKHKTSDFGLSLMHSISSGWFNNCNPADILEINKNIEIIKERIKSEPFFQNLVEKYFLTNLHTLTCIMEPDPRYTDELSREEENRLSSKTSALSESEKNKIYEQSIELIQKQEAEEDLSVLPSLRVSDISREMRRIPLEHHNLENCPVQWRTTVTNGITYFRMISKIGELPDELKIYLPLFAQALTSLGTKTKTMAEIDDDIRLYTGGINASPFVSTNHSDIDQYEEGIVIASHCLDRNINQMYDIMQQLLRETNFDNVEKLRTMIYGNATNMMNSVVESGHAYAKTFAASRIAPAMANSEVYGGMTQVYFMNKLAGTEDFQSVINKLKEISLYLLSKSSLRVAITCGAEAVNQNEVMLKKFLPSFPDVAKSSSHAVERPKFQISHEKAFFPLPFAVNFSAKCFRGTPYTHPDGSKLQVLSSLMKTHYLHREIREKNGAYGGGAVYSPTSGIFSFFSYRDPKTLETLETYKQAIDWVANRKFSQQEMDEAKLSIFQGIDAPISVAQEGLVYFEGRINDDMRQLRREQLLSVTEDDIKEAAKILEQQEHLNWSSVTIIGEGKPEILEDNKWKVYQ
ncbi:peptidase M16C associated-domain-containing protein [Gigaspora rosea]|uniref:Presequence protease, mitochondrial n=1 Tax=Gigaspora rosea TaxID=44941 RepID=A0A397U259_9GLOM|nr:peptidase M16C associated-domain-containing protein [Gigaspora rosea]